MATVRRPSSLAARMTRMAISPRLATRMLRIRCGMTTFTLNISVEIIVAYGTSCDPNPAAARTAAQAPGCAPPPKGAEPRAKTTLFDRGALGGAGCTDPALLQA